MATEGRYSLLRPLGQGASGDVHLAVDRLRGERRVALKCLRTRVDDALRAAMAQEFGAMAGVSIPGVAAVHDFGVGQVVPGKGPVPYFTRDYVEGVALDEAAAGRSVSECAALVAAVGAALSPLHRAGVIHGDLKPANVVVDAGGQPHLIDFGLSRVLGVRAQGPTGGTPAYMAPERLSGQPPDVASDVYALGVILYHFVHGGPPAAWRVGGGVAERLRGVELAMPAGAEGPGRALLEVALRAMRPAPVDRFPTVAEMVVALDALAPPSGPRPRVFVPPRPRALAEPLSRLEVALRPGSETERVAQLVVGQDGAGRTTLLRELKWRLQLRGVRVCEVAARAGQGSAALLSLFDEVLSVCDRDGPGVAEAEAETARLRAGQLAETRTADALAGLLETVAGDSAVVVLVDDLDRAEAVVGAVLRSTLHAVGRARVGWVVSARDPDASACKALLPRLCVRLEPLPAGEVAAMAAEVLGPVDDAVAEGLQAHSDGNPAAVVDLLAGLFARDAAPTAADLDGLSAGVHGRALSEARLVAVSPALRRLLSALALCGGALPRPVVARLLGEDARGVLDAGGAAGLLQLRSGQVRILDPIVERGLRGDSAGDAAGALCSAVLVADPDAQLPAPLRARLSLQASEPLQALACAESAIEQLMGSGAFAAAAELTEGLLAAAPADLPVERRLSISLSRIRAHEAMGDHEATARLSQALLAAPALPEDVGVEACLMAGRALTALADFDGAVRVLAAMPGAASPRAQARAAQELAKVYMRRGDYAALDAAADRGLACAPPDDVARVELLCCKGVVAAYHADAPAARGFHEQALQLAIRVGASRDQARALTYLGIGAWRAGDLVEARELLSQSLEISLQDGDVARMANAALNLGAILYYLGEPAAAEAHYERAARLARRAGSAATELQARNNLAHIHVYFGLYEQARVEAELVRERAQQAGHRYLVAQASAVEGDLCARTGQPDAALIHYDEAVGIYAALGQSREQAEHHMDAAELLLDRGGPADASAAVARLSLAREQLAAAGARDLQTRLDLLLSRAQTQSGDGASAIEALRGLLARVRQGQDREIEWMVLAALAEAQRAGGGEFAANRTRGAALELLEELSLRLPRDHRDAFWLDPRRRAVRQAVLARAPSSDHSVFDGAAVGRVLADPRMERLLEIIKRLARERELPRLLERITESAVDLAGAERGLVLLVEPGGKLQPQVARDRGGVPAPDAAFSRSIAEAVLIDGEPLVTVDATDDGRLSEYASVHRLMLRSVACLPIRSGERVVGVLYLEHRRSKGRFGEEVVELLHAFADQAAIAIDGAQLLQDKRAREAQLQEANARLEQATRELEDLLSARTHALDEAQEELSRAQAAARRRYERHGMVGRSEAMLRVYSAIERLRDTPVPVVICGESGTGKELVARALHYGGKRARRPFVAVNCGALPETLLESELFGHVKGSFSGADRDRDGMIARASGGTLFLDEVGDMPRQMQVDLLRVLQEGTVRKLGGDREEAVSIRVIAASQVPLQALVDAGRFRADLFYRLNVVELRLPALRERRQDIAPLCDHFLRAFAERDGLPPKRLSGPALDALLRQPWPGNVRQLEHLLLQAWVMADGSTVGLGDLRLEDGVGLAEEAGGEGGRDVDTDHGAGDTDGALPANVDEHRSAEKQRILGALEDTGWNRARAAKSLGIPRRTFYRRLQEYGIL